MKQTGPMIPSPERTYVERKSRFKVAVLGFLLGGLGLHRLYLGNHILAAVFFLSTFIACLMPMGESFLLLAVIGIIASLDTLQLMFRSNLYFIRSSPI